MRELRTELREYVDQTIERIDANDVLRRNALPTQRRSWTRPMASAAIAATGAVLLVVATVIAIEVVEEGPPTSAGTAIPSITAPTVTSPATAIDPTTTFPVADAAASLVWSRGEVEASENASIASVAVADGYLVAVGERTSSASADEYPSDAAVWVSRDGLTWTAVESPSFKGLRGDDTDGLGWFDRSQIMIDVAAGPLGVIAVGRDEVDGAIWTSPDALSWSQISDERLQMSGGFVAVAASGPGWIVVGDDDHGNGWVWTSFDGVEWTAVTEPFTMAEYGAPVALYDVAAFDDQIVVVGSIGFDDTSGFQNAVWMSPDGLDWTLAATGKVPYYSVSASPDGKTLIGFDETPLLSTDGVRWTASVEPGPPPGAHVTFEEGWAIAAGRARWTEVWVSTDGGATWTKTLPGVEGFSEDSWLVDCARIGDHVVVVGTVPGLATRAALGDAIGSTAQVFIATWAGA